MSYIGLGHKKINKIFINKEEYIIYTNRSGGVCITEKDSVYSRGYINIADLEVVGCKGFLNTSLPKRLIKVATFVLKYKIKVKLLEKRAFSMSYSPTASSISEILRIRKKINKIAKKVNPLLRNSHISTNSVEDSLNKAFKHAVLFNYLETSNEKIIEENNKLMQMVTYDKFITAKEGDILGTLPFTGQFSGRSGMAIFTKNKNKVYSCGLYQFENEKDFQTIKNKRELERLKKIDKVGWNPGGAFGLYGVGISPIKGYTQKEYK